MTSRAMKYASFLFGLLAFLGLLHSARAGESYVDSTTFALSGYDAVAYFELQETTPPRSGVAGSRKITAPWNGAIYAFASTENRDKFLANPTRYAPQFDGHCAWAAGQGYKAPGSPSVWRIVDGKLYLNYSNQVRRRWEKRRAPQIQKAEANWKKIGNDPRATGDAADYDPAAAPKP